MARTRALSMLVAAAAARSGIGRASAASSASHALPPRAGARAALRVPRPCPTLSRGASSGARAGVSSGARAGGSPRARAAVPKLPKQPWTPGPDSFAEAWVGLHPLPRGAQIALLGAYACAAVYTFLASPSPEEDEDEDQDSFALPSFCYPPGPEVHYEAYMAMSLRPPPPPTRKDMEDVKILLMLILNELRKSKSKDELAILLKTLITEFLTDPSTYILFPYLALSACIENIFGDRLSLYECPFSGLFELPSRSCFEEDSNNSSSEESDVNVEWGKNMWVTSSENSSTKTCEESLNVKIVMSINKVATKRVLKCLRYEIRDISPPIKVKKAVEMQAEAERRKGSQILESEGAMLDQANRAKGEAEAILAWSQATAKGNGMVSESMSAEGSTEAANLRVAEQYIKAFGALAKNTTTMILPSDAGNPAAMIAQSLNIFKPIFKPSSTKEGSHQVEEVGKQTNLL